MKRHLNLSLNAKLGIAAGILAAAALVTWGVIVWVISNQPNLTVAPPIQEPLNTNSVIAPSDTALLPRQLDGVLVPSGEEAQYPIAVMIENAAFGGVRPQFGLGYAQVVYELPVEGGITRFMALFSGELPEKLGPVRSARPTYLEFSSEYDALYAHAGGSPEALQAVSGLEVKDLSALGADSRFFYRDTERVAPHNLFTSADKLVLARRDKGLDSTKPTFTAWSFKEDNASATPMTEPLVIDFGSGPLYTVSYRFDAATNSYERGNGGEVQTDAASGDTLMVKNVIVQMIPAGIPAGADGRVNYTVTGTGKAYFAIDGKIIEGTWSKADRTSRTLFLNSQGDPINFNRGSIWIELLPATGTITLPQ